MTDETKHRTVKVELDEVTLQKLMELQPAVAGFAAAEFGEEITSPADVTALAIHLLHVQVFARAHAMLADAEPDGARPH